MLGAGGGLVGNLRSQILSRGLAGVSAFRRGVRMATGDGSGDDAHEITQDAFRTAASLAGANLTVSSVMNYPSVRMFH